VGQPCTLTRYPDAHICADYSHWVVVAERNLSDAEAIMERCAAHCIHLHTRVGHSQGAVPDPAYLAIAPKSPPMNTGGNLR
jgi:hypothetical protein